MTEKEVVQALRCCAEGECKDCAMHEDIPALRQSGRRKVRPNERAAV